MDPKVQPNRSWDAAEREASQLNDHDKLFRKRKDTFEGVPLSHEDFEQAEFNIEGRIGNAFFRGSETVGGHRVTSEIRLENVASYRGVETVLNVGFMDQWSNIAHVKSAQMPIFNFFALAEAVVDRDKQKAVDAVHEIFKYEAPDIIDKGGDQSISQRAQWKLEYRLLETNLWNDAAQGQEIALINPSIPTLRRVFNVKGELEVYFTNTTRLGDEQFDEIRKLMKEIGYVYDPIRVQLGNLPIQKMYYFGFNGGGGVKRTLVNSFGFELNPYHPDALNGMMAGVYRKMDKVIIEFARTSYYRSEEYVDDPTYYRYYGDVLRARIVDVQMAGVEAFNFVCGREVPGFIRTSGLLNEGDVLCDGFFFSEEIVRKEMLKNRTYYIDAQNKVVDVDGTMSYENRRKQLVGLPWEVATGIRDSRKAKIAFIRYRTEMLTIASIRSEMVPKEQRVRVLVDRPSATYGTVRANYFHNTGRNGCTHVKTSDGIRKLNGGQYPCADGEYVQMLTHSILIAKRIDHGDPRWALGIDGILTRGFTPYNCVAIVQGEYWTLRFTRIDVDYKANFTLGQVFKSYAKYMGPFIKHSAIMSKARIKKRQIDIAKESFGEEELCGGDDLEILNGELTV